MSLWSMNDGSALSHNVTTNGTTALESAGTSFITDGIRSGDIIVTAGGESLRVRVVSSSSSILLAEAASGSESGVAATLRKPPTEGMASVPGGNALNTNVFGVSEAESLAGGDNLTSIGVSTVTLGTQSSIGGATYNGSAPTVTVAAPTIRTIATSMVSTSAESITQTAHGMRTGTKLTYQDGSGTALAGLTDNTAYYVIYNTADTVKLASSLSNANAGTAINLTGTGNNAQTFQGDTATATATVTSGAVTSVAVATVGSDYQSDPAVTVAAPTGSGSLNLTSSSVLIVADDEIVVPSAMYAAISTGDAVTYTQGSSGAQTNLTTTTVYYLIKSGTSNKISLATSTANAVAGTKIDLTAVASGGTAHTLIGATATLTANRGTGDTAVGVEKGFHVGWVKRTVGSGGRAGRVHYETLVAASSISGDHEDIAFVEDA